MQNARSVCSGVAKTGDASERNITGGIVTDSYSALTASVG